MTRTDSELIAALYLPLSVTVLARVALGRQPRQFSAALLSTLYTLPALTLLQQLNQTVHWWSFPPTTSLPIAGMPAELFCGWTILWGILPQFALARVALVPSAAILIALDLLLMPRLTTVHLHLSWLLGEFVAITLVLLPALTLGHLTLHHTHLRTRATLQTLTAALLFLYLLPSLTFAFFPSPTWTTLRSTSAWITEIAAQLLLFLAVPGLNAIQEFATRGNGTPIPYDPPTRLVTSGIFRYIRNPMQVSTTLVLLGLAALLRSAWLLLIPAITLIYSAGIAEWDEAQDLHQRFGAPWLTYRAHVRNWIPGWRPFHAGPPAHLYIARTCGPCSDLRRWFDRHPHTGLLLLDAETLAPGTTDRLLYHPADGTPPTHGLRAFARALEHLNLPFAFAGATLRLPVIAPLTQLLLDASGLGPRQLPQPHPVPPA